MREVWTQQGPQLITNIDTDSVHFVHLCRAILCLQQIDIMQTSQDLKTRIDISYNSKTTPKLKWLPWDKVLQLNLISLGCFGSAVWPARPSDPPASASLPSVGAPNVSIYTPPSHKFWESELPPSYLLSQLPHPLSHLSGPFSSFKRVNMSLSTNISCNKTSHLTS